MLGASEVDAVNPFLGQVFLLLRAAQSALTSQQNFSLFASYHVSKWTVAANCMRDHFVNLLCVGND